MVSITLGDAVRARREELGLSQTALAEQANVGRAWLSQLEVGRMADPSVWKLARLAGALDLDLALLLGEQGRGAVVLSAQVTEARITAAKLLGMLAELDPQTREDAVTALAIGSDALQETVNYGMSNEQSVDAIIHIIDRLRDRSMAIATGSLLSSSYRPGVFRDQVLARRTA